MSTKTDKAASKRRRKIKAQSLLAFAVTRNACGQPESMTMYSGRRSLTRALPPQMASMLVAALSPEGQSL